MLAAHVGWAAWYLADKHSAWVRRGLAEGLQMEDQQLEEIWGQLEEGLQAHVDAETTPIAAHLVKVNHQATAHAHCLHTACTGGCALPESFMRRGPPNPNGRHSVPREKFQLGSTSCCWTQLRGWQTRSRSR